MLWGRCVISILTTHSVHEIIASALIGGGDGLADFTGLDC